MIYSAVSRTGCIIAHHLPTRTENISFSLQFSGPLVTNSLFPPMFYAGTLLTVLSAPAAFCVTVSLK